MTRHKQPPPTETPADVEVSSSEVSTETREPARALPMARSLSLEEVAELMGAHVTTVWKMVRTGELGCAFRMGRQWRIWPDQLREWTRLNSVGAEPEERYIRISEAASYLKKPYAHVETLIASGAVRTKQINTQTFVLKRDVDGIREEKRSKIRARMADRVKARRGEKGPSPEAQPKIKSEAKSKRTTPRKRAIGGAR